MSSSARPTDPISSQPAVVIGQPSKGKSFLFAIIIIVGIGGMIAVAMGLKGGVQSDWWQAGSLSTISQLDAVLMMSLGGGGGLIALAIGVAGFIKNYSSLFVPTQNTLPSPMVIIRPTVFGVEQWQERGVTISSVPPIPQQLLEQQGEGDLLVLIPSFTGLDDMVNFLQRAGCLVKIGSMDCTLEKYLTNSAPQTPYWVLWKEDMGTFFTDNGSKADNGPKAEWRYTMTLEESGKRNEENRHGQQAGYKIPTIYEATVCVAVRRLMKRNGCLFSILTCEHDPDLITGYAPTLSSDRSGLTIGHCSARFQRNIHDGAVKYLIKKAEKAPLSIGH